MNIGIATFHLSNNYGAVLQALALQTFLRDAGHSVQIVDGRFAPPVSWARTWFSKTPRGCLRKWELAVAAMRFQHFRERRLILTPEIFRSMDQLDLLAGRFDLLISGSDQVWNPLWIARERELADFYFLAFGGDRPRRISYAASFGRAGLESLEEADRRLLSTGLRRLDAISVRERTGVSMVRESCGRGDAVQVCDPTLLLEPGYYHRLAGRKPQSERILFQFMLHGREGDADPVSREIAANLVLRVRRCDVKKTGLHRGYALPSPEAWLGHIRDAGFVVTNSFHAVVFCLVFQTPFLALPVPGRIASMNARIVEFLDAVGLRDRILAPGERPSPERAGREIDWEQVARRMTTMRTEGGDFLKGQLALALHDKKSSTPG